MATKEKSMGKSPEEGKIEILSAQNDVDVARAAWAAKGGKPVALHLGSVCGIVGDGSNPNFVVAVASVKGEGRQQKALAGIVTAQEVCGLVDVAQMPPALQAIFADPVEVALSLGDIAFFRFPLKADKGGEIPPSMITVSGHGRRVFQAFIPDRNRTLSRLHSAMEQQGISWPAGTSLNPSGVAELVEEPDGIAFVENNQHIRHFLRSGLPPQRRRGSYPILSIEEGRTALVRQGFIPASDLEVLLGVEIDISRAAPAKFAQTVFPREFDNLDRHRRKKAMHSHLIGEDLGQIMDTV